MSAIEDIEDIVGSENGGESLEVDSVPIRTKGRKLVPKLGAGSRANQSLIDNLRWALCFLNFSQLCHSCAQNWINCTHIWVQIDDLLKPHISTQGACICILLVFVTFRPWNCSSVCEDVGLLAQQLGRGVHGRSARRRRIPCDRGQGSQFNRITNRSIIWQKIGPKIWPK